MSWPSSARDSSPAGAAPGSPRTWPAVSAAPHLDDQLAGVSVLLASVPAPAMPDRVAQRLDTVLAAEVARRDNAERARGDGAGESPRSPAPQRPRGNRGFRPLALRVLAPAAAVVLLAAGGYGLSRAGLGASSESAATSAGSATKPASSPAAGARRANAPAAGAVSRPQGITSGNIVVVTSNENFSRAGLAQQVEAALRAPASGTGRAASPQLRDCVLRLAGGRPLQRVESVHFEGRPAILVVARTGAGDTAWIAAPDCSATNRHVLDMTSLP